MYMQVNISNNPFSVHFETLEIRGHISDHTMSHVATTRNYQYQVFNEDGLLHSREANFSKSDIDMLTYMTVSENIYIKLEVVLPCKQEFSFTSLTCANAHANDMCMHTHTMFTYLYTYACFQN